MCFRLVFVVCLLFMYLFWLSAESVIICSTFLLYLFSTFLCVFELAPFLNLQHISPTGNVFGHCIAFVLVGHNRMRLGTKISLKTFFASSKMQ